MIETAVGGEYLFKMASDDGARIRINDKIVLEHDGLHGAVLKQRKLGYARVCIRSGSNILRSTE